MTEYRATREDIRELSEAYVRVTAVRKELAEAEEKVHSIRKRLHAVEHQLGNAIRQVVKDQ